MTAYISAAQAKTLPGLFLQRVQNTPELPAYMFFDAINETWTNINWGSMQVEVQRWMTALAAEKIQTGDKVAIMARNSRYWVMFDQAALALGLVLIPLYLDDRADNVSYILADADVKLLVIGGEAQWQLLHNSLAKNKRVKRIVSIGDISAADDKRVRQLGNWLPGDAEELVLPELDPNDLATIVYTSGTTGRPKGVMLSHKNILTNAESCLQAVGVETQTVFLSFLPLSHTLERTVGYYLAIMAGACVAHARSIPDLARDLLVIRPHGLISVPRIYERVYAKIRENLQNKSVLQQRFFALAVEVGWHKFEVEQGRAKKSVKLLLWPLLKRLVADKVTRKLGGRLELAISGGAALPPEVSKVFIGLGVPLLQGYGLTETSPVISVNRLDNNIPASIGTPVDGVEVRIGENDELQVRGDNVMLAYWNNAEATEEIIDSDGWLGTGDKARIDTEHLYITGRIKDIIVLANGEKVSPADMELAIAADDIFDQLMVIGESKPYLTGLVVLSESGLEGYFQEQGIDASEITPHQLEELLLERIATRLHDFPGYAVIHRISISKEQWTIENNLLTPTLKVKRKEIQALYKEQIEQMYADH